MAVLMLYSGYPFLIVPLENGVSQPPDWDTAFKWIERIGKTGYNRT